MTLDLVHDIQQSYRKLVDAMSRPGRIRNIAAQAEKVEPADGCLPSTLVLAFALLDTEVTFKIYAGHETGLAKRFNQLTYARAAEAEAADYIFVLRDAAPRYLEHAIQCAKTGDLMNPHESATVIVETDDLSYGQELILKGPGIEAENGVRVKTAGSWVDRRAEKNAEFPLGIDCIFVDPQHNLMCLPRTTQILGRVVG